MGLVLRPVSPAALALGNNNDYAAIGDSSWARLTPNAGGSNLTGIVAPAAINEGSVIVLTNVGAGALNVIHQSAASAAANRFLLAGGVDIAVNPNESISVIYDNTTQRWRNYF